MFARLLAVDDGGAGPLAAVALHHVPQQTHHANHRTIVERDPLVISLADRIVLRPAATLVLIQQDVVGNAYRFPAPVPAGRSIEHLIPRDSLGIRLRPSPGANREHQEEPQYQCCAFRKTVENPVHAAARMLVPENAGLAKPFTNKEPLLQTPRPLAVS
jgi:hypothetical protein